MLDNIIAWIFASNPHMWLTGSFLTFGYLVGHIWNDFQRPKSERGWEGFVDELPFLAFIVCVACVGFWPIFIVARLSINIYKLIRWCGRKTGLIEIRPADGAWGYVNRDELEGSINLAVQRAVRDAAFPPELLEAIRRNTEAQTARNISPGIMPDGTGTRSMDL